jgi:hypothetical protein
MVHDGFQKLTISDNGSVGDLQNKRNIAMKKLRLNLITLTVIRSILLIGCQSGMTPSTTNTSLDPTGGYLAQLDLKAIMDRGSDYATMANSPFMSLPVFDNLILLELHAMECQKASRMIADIYSAAGYESRLVDMYGQRVAEVKYDGGGHYAEADLFGGGQIVTLPGGTIRSMAELSTHYPLLDKMQVYLANNVLFSDQNYGG